MCDLSQKLRSNEHLVFGIHFGHVKVVSGLIALKKV